MLDTVRFLLFIFIFLWLPGELFLKWAQINSSFIRRVPLSFVIGVSLLILISLSVRFLQLPWEILYLYGCGLVIAGSKYIPPLVKRVMPIRFTLYDVSSFIVLIVCVVVISAVYFGSGVYGSLYLPAARDAFWRLAITGELMQHFPPQNPGFPPELLKNYHFFYDLFLAATAHLTRIEIIDLYTRYVTLFAASLFTLSIGAALETLVKNKWLRLYGTVLTLFTGNLSYLILSFVSSAPHVFAKGNMFMSDQPFDQIHNPFNILAYAVVLVLFILFTKWEKNRNWRIFFLITICTTVLVGLKIYAGILVLIGLAGVSIIELIKRRFYWYMVIPFITCFLVVLFIQGPKPTSLYFNPGWVLTKMVEDQDRLPLPDLVLKERYYENAGNMMRLVQIKFEELFIYFAGNLNVRIIGLAGLVLLFFQKRFSKLVVAYIIALTGAALFLPLLFSQTRGVYDSIQFTPYGLVFLGLLTMVGIELLIQKLPATTRLFSSSLILVIILGFALPTTIFGLLQIGPGRFYEVTKFEVEALRYIRAHSSGDALVLTDLDNEKLVHMYVPALSERRVFLSGVSLVDQTGIDITSRQQEIQDFFRFDELISSQELVQKKNYLNKKQIAFIYLSRSGLEKKSLIDKLGLPIFYQNQEVMIYQII